MNLRSERGEQAQGVLAYEFKGIDGKSKIKLKYAKVNIYTMINNHVIEYK